VGNKNTPSLEDRLQALEDQLAIYQVICSYGYAVDGCNSDAVASVYAEDGVYAVGDIGAFEGRDRIAAITRDEGHLGLVGRGCAHMSSLPFVVLDGDCATATCHTMVAMKNEDGFYIGRLSASRISLSRDTSGVWRIDHRQNYMLNGDKAGPALLTRLKEGPGAGPRVVA